MRYTIEYSTLQDPKTLRKIGKEDLRAIREAIEEKLTLAPDMFGKPLRFSLHGHRRLRVGDFRVVYRIEGHKVKIILIGHRSMVYEGRKRARS